MCVCVCVCVCVCAYACACVCVLHVYKDYTPVCGYVCTLIKVRSPIMPVNACKLMYRCTSLHAGARVRVCVCVCVCVCVSQ